MIFKDGLEGDGGFESHRHFGVLQAGQNTIHDSLDDVVGNKPFIGKCLSDAIGLGRLVAVTHNQLHSMARTRARRKPWGLVSSGNTNMLSMIGTLARYFLRYNMSLVHQQYYLVYREQDFR